MTTTSQWYGTSAHKRYGTAITPDPYLYENIRRHPGDTGATFVTVSDTAYFCFIGRFIRPVVVDHVVCFTSSNGSGAQTAEVGLFSSTAAPGTALSLSKIVATGTVDTLIASAGRKQNTNAFSTVIPAGTYVWAGLRTALASTQPTFRGFEYDWGRGFVLSTATAGALTNAGPWTGALTGTGINTSGPSISGRIV